ncbi:MAG: hypothetical protein EA422_04920 [Gemmatimonadales bacterium]|nr:MAG: hypothetical protein EA422_04920 [Gemmatimonadales bacterium]
MEPLSFVLLLALGIWAALDGVSVGQFMVSRPLVTATLTGLLLGDPATGLILGIFLEVVYLGGIPAGAVRLPEPGPAAIPATVGAILIGGPGGLAFGAASGMVLAILGGWTVVRQRRWQGRLVASVTEAGNPPRAVSRALGMALFLDGLRGALLVGLGIVLMAAIPEGWIELWPLPFRDTYGVLFVLAALPAGSLLNGLPLKGERRWAFLGTGLALGVGVALWGLL